MNEQKVLIVEDESIIALDLKTRLKQLGYQVVGTAANGPDAVEKTRQLGPHMVLMDINLQGEMDGTEAARLISEESDIPIVFLTAYSSNDILEDALRSGPYGYLLKPVDTRELHTTLQTTLRRHALEQQIALSERRLQLALDAAGMGVWEWEPRSGRFVTTGMFGKILGETPAAVDESIEDFLARLLPDGRDKAEEVLKDALGQKGRINCQFPYQRAANEIGWLQLHATVHEETGKLWVTGVVQDITERHQMEEELLQSAVVFETLSEGLFTLDAEGLLTSANPAFERLTGYSLDEAMGRDPEQFLHARRHADRFYRRLSEQQDGQWQGEVQCRRKDGGIFPVWESVRAVMDAQGRLSRYVAAITDISELRRAEAEVHHLAYHDVLTGLPNRMLLADRLDYTINLMELKQSHCAVLFMDLDGFKLINDTMGHAIGDRLLQIAGYRLQRTLRSTDTLARVGGDEFVVVVGDLEDPGDAALKVAHNLLNTLADPIDLGGKMVSVSGSVGIALYPQDGTDRETLMQAADTAMYHAKAQGKTQINFYTRELASRISERMNLEQDLRRAIDGDELRVYYQPQFSLDGENMIGVEALVRWQHPEMGLLAPGSFISIAEEAGLIGSLGNWVLESACRQLAGWQRHSGKSLRLSINVSAQQIRHGSLIEEIARVLAETGLPPSSLEIEITESTLQNLEESRCFVDALHEMGITVAIDDFGTGYSSLSVLKHLHIDRLKIDQSFVRDIPQNLHDVGIVEAIIAMAHKLDLQTLAEGIETVEQLSFLREAGCTEGQGYLLARPAPWDEIIKAPERGN